MGNNPQARKRQKKRRKERAAAEQLRERRKDTIKYSIEHTPHRDVRLRHVSCTRKKRYDTEGQAIHACITCSAKRGVTLSWYGCEYCGGWHITSRPMRERRE